MSVHGSSLSGSRSGFSAGHHHDSKQEVVLLLGTVPGTVSAVISYLQGLEDALPEGINLTACPQDV